MKKSPIDTIDALSTKHKAQKPPSRPGQGRRKVRVSKSTPLPKKGK